jgi:energy-coupling factor transporter ATP-binding protein EcfA2
MTEADSSIPSIKRGGRGAEFIKADLHLHTHGSYDYKDDVDAEDIVEKLEEEDIELVAVTDHDEMETYQEVRSATEGKNLEVLPGVEITTPQGSERQIHMTAIFPPEKSEEVDSLLHEIGIKPSDPQDAQADAKISAIAEAVVQKGGIPILAHIDEKAGADFELDRENPIKDDIFDADVKALEIVEEETSEEYPEFTHIQSSDAHSLDEIGRNYTYLKMTEPSFEGLRLALTDSESRVSLEEEINRHPRITGIRVDGSFLEDKEVKLNPNLNCLIGGKGTGKSTVVELIRYVFNEESQIENISEKSQSIVEANLGPGGVVEAHIVTEDSKKYVIRREYSEDPEVLRPTGEEVMDISAFKREFFNLEVFSQMELLELARDELSQMKLLDSYFDLKGLKKDKSEAKKNLEDNRKDLKGYVRKREELKEKLKDYDAIKEKIQVMEDKGVQEHLEKEEEWDKEKKTLSDTVSSIKSVKKFLEENKISEKLDVPDHSEETLNKELVEEAKDETKSLIEAVEDLEEKILDKLKSKQADVSQIRNRWSERREERLEEIEKMSEKIKEETDVDIDEYMGLKEEKIELDGLDEELDEINQEIDDLEEERGKLKSKIASARQDIRRKRKEGIENLNKSLNDVKVELKPNSNRDEYTQWITDVLQGQYINTEDRKKLARVLEPSDLRKIVKEENYQRLEEEGFTENTSEKIIDTLREHLYELEIQEIKDSPDIQIKDGEWKSLEKMSDGQKCTALLSIAMIEREIPLIIDQPEDQLDNEFVYTEVVDIIRQIKNNRQVIIATHNANIPVLGDAEQIVVMDSDGINGHFSCRGSIENERVKGRAQSILEGGERAFRMRTEKYGI